MNCPARNKIPFVFLWFTFMVGQPHEYKRRARYQMWWTVTGKCAHCGVSYEQWPLDDYQLMQEFNLVKMPPHPLLSIGEEELLKYTKEGQAYIQEVKAVLESKYGYDPNTAKNLSEIVIPNFSISPEELVDAYKENGH